MTWKPDTEAAQLLAGHSAHVATVALAAVQRILHMVPRATLRTRLGWKLIGFSAPSYLPRVCPAIARCISLICRRNSLEFPSWKTEYLLPQVV